MKNKYMQLPGIKFYLKRDFEFYFHLVMMKNMKVGFDTQAGNQGWFNLQMWVQAARNDNQV